MTAMLLLAGAILGDDLEVPFWQYYIADQALSRILIVHIEMGLSLSSGCGYAKAVDVLRARSPKYSSACLRARS